MFELTDPRLIFNLLPMLNFRLLLGQSINNFFNGVINRKYNALLFIPNGRYHTLDIKRSDAAINIVFDVGANIGQTCLMLTKAFPKAKIYSFEPVPDTYQQLKINTKQCPNINCVNLALGAKKERLSILSNPNSELNSLKKVAENESQTSIIIEADTADNFCKANGITQVDLLKIDTEGYELEVLNGFDETFLEQKVKFIYAEAGFEKNDASKTAYADLDTRLKQLGFTTSGFYEPMRWGKHKLRLGFCNVLFVNINLLNSGL